MNNSASVPEILYTDPNFVVVAKPAHLLVHGVKGHEGEEPTLADWLVDRYPELKNVGDDPKNRPGIVHRLDRDTSGVIIVPRTPEFFSYIKKLFQSHEVVKEYVGLAWGDMQDDAGVINLPIGIRNGSTKRTVHIKTARMVKEAVTEYKVRKRLMLGGEPVTLLSLSPKTGRTHQLRIHLAALHHPIVGDMLYGGNVKFLKSKALGVTRHFLHAESLEFTREDGKRLKVSAPLPQDLSRVLDQAKPYVVETQ